MARSTEQRILDAFEHYAEHPEGLDYPAVATPRGTSRATIPRRRRWVPIAAFAVVAATLAAVLILIPLRTKDNRGDTAVVAPPVSTAATVGTATTPATGASTMATTAIDTSPVVSSPTSRIGAIVVPNVVGLTEAQAREALSAIGLPMRTTTEPSEEAMRERAVAQSPAGGADVRPGTAVTVTFGAGPEMVTVPGGLVGMSLDQARHTLTEAGLTVADEAVDSPEPKGQVLSITVPDGSTWVSGRAVSKGTVVRVTWSNNSQFIMPNVTQQTPESAAKTLEEAGWAGDVETLKDAATARPSTEPSQVGLILGQRNPVGSVVDKAARISVEIGTIQLLFVPDLTGLTVAQATGTLRALGWVGELVVGDEVRAVPGGDGGTIATQSPGGGSQITVLDDVTVSVYGR